MSRPLVVATALVAGGILLGLLRPVPTGGGPLPFPALALAVSGAVFCGLAALHWTGPPRRVLAVALVLAGLLLGVSGRSAAAHACRQLLPDGVPTLLYGRVESRTGERLRLVGDSVGAAGAPSLSCAGPVNARWAGDPRGGARPEAGAPVVVLGRWWTPPGAGAGLTRAGAFMADSVARLESAGSGGAGALLSRARSAAQRRLDTLFGDGHAALASSLLLANRDGLDRELRDRYARSGLSHLLAISGLHVGLVAGILLLLAGMTPLAPAARSGLAVAGTITYVLFLGAPASALRAALQIALLLLGRTLQRPASGATAIATAALVILALDPAELLAPGFQLSFAGVVGLLALRRPILAALAPATRPIPGRARRWLADGVATSLAATVATAPVVAWHFGSLAPIGVVANLVAIPLLGALVPTLALTLAAGWVWHPAGAFLAGAGVVLLDALDRCAAVAAAVPGGSVDVSGRATAMIAGAVLIGWWATGRLGRVRPAVRRAAWAACAVACFVLSGARPGVARVEVHVIDVGQGDAIALRTPARRWLLVDAGVSGPGHDAGRRLVVPYLRRHGASRIEGLILTHPHLDHIGGAGAAIRALRPRWIGDPGAIAGQGSYLGLLHLADSAGAAWLALHEGMDLEIDGVLVEFLHPSGPAGEVEDPNDASVVARVSYGEFSVLLTGDAGAVVEAALVARYGDRLEAEVLKVGHHGSATSTTPALLASTRSRIALISAGRGNRYGHPNRGVLDRLEAAGLRVVRTDRAGSIVVRGSRRGEIEIEMERGTP